MSCPSTLYVRHAPWLDEPRLLRGSEAVGDCLCAEAHARMGSSMAEAEPPRLHAEARPWSVDTIEVAARRLHSLAQHEAR